MTKMTYVNAIDYILNTAESMHGQDDSTFVEACEKLEALKASLVNRKSSAKTLTKTQVENEGIKKLIVQTLADSGEKMTVTGLLGCEGLGGYTNQKISALLRQLVEANKVTKTLEGKKAYFSINAE